jgi:hypothetical protein
MADFTLETEEMEGTSQEIMAVTVDISLEGMVGITQVEMEDIFREIMGDITQDQVCPK